MKTIKKTLTPVILFVILLLTFINTDAQQNTVSIAASGAVVLNFVKPWNAGDPVLQVTHDENWLNYNITATSGENFSVMVQLESALPNGLQLKIVAGTIQGATGSMNTPAQRGSNYNDAPAGDSPGIPATPVTLSLAPQVLVYNIGSFDTGIGAFVGHKLTYTISISDYSNLRANSSDINVLYTLTQQP